MIFFTTFFYLFFAVILGALIGFERQVRQRTAGLRTNALVALGSAAFVTVGILVPDEISPTRIAAQVVSGIGFLCAGVIMRDGLSVRGLNTAATVWCSAAVGVMCGTGYVAEATMVAVVVVTAHMVLRPLSNRINATPVHEPENLNLDGHFGLALSVDSADSGQVRGLMVQLISHTPLSIISMDTRRNNSEGLIELKVELNGQENQSHHLEQLAGRLQIERGVQRVTWRFVTQGAEPAVSLFSGQTVAS